MKNKILFVLSLLFGLTFINSGLNKFFHYMPVPDDLPQGLMNQFASMMEIPWLMPLLAIAEITGGILIVPPKTRALGAVIVFPVMLGILLTHLMVEPSGLMMAVALMAVLLWVMYENRHKYLPMVG